MSNAEQEKREYFRKLYTEDPAKHFVRVNGWLNVARTRLQTIRSEARRKSDFVRYFTFPGEHAIDVLLFAENGVIDENKVGFPGVVYCERQPEILSAINRKLGRCKGVFRCAFESAVFRDDFKSYCPFDIINLDLTKEVFPLDGKTESNTIRAIGQLLWLHKNRSFDLFLTFKSSLKETNPQAVEEFVKMISDNFRNNKTLEQEFIKHCQMRVEDLRKKSFTLFWCKSFPKWILESGLTNNIVGSTQGEFVYMRKPKFGEPYDIVTFLFSFKRNHSGLMGKHKMVNETQEEILKTFAFSPMLVNEYLSNNKTEEENLRHDAIRISQRPPKVSPT